jgi:hypothetical protein
VFTYSPRYRCVKQGSLSSVVVLPIGSSIAQIPQAEPVSTNVLQNTYEPNVGFWNQQGAAPLLVSQNKWNASFIPVEWRSTNGAADSYAETIATAGIVGAAVYTFSGQFSIDTGLSVTASTIVRIALQWTGPGGRTDYLDFNPANGQVVGSSGVTGITANTFVTQQTAGGSDITVLDLSFTMQATPAGVTGAVAWVYPNRNAGAACFHGGGFQLESGIQQTAPMPTVAVAGATNTRRLGTIPRYEVDRGLQPFTFPDATIYEYVSTLDEGRLFWMPPAVPVTNMRVPANANNGEWFRFEIDQASSCVFTRVAGCSFSFPDGTSAATFTLTPGTNHISGMMVFFAAQWHVFYDATGTATGPSVVPAAGGAGTILRSNGTTWAVSQSTYPDLIASGNVVHATAANTIGSSANFTYSGSGLALNNLLDISQAAGGQIKFPASQNASANANTLDDYEEGTYTPTDASGAGLTFSAVEGLYVKIGQFVTLAYTITFPATADGSAASFGGTPFVPTVGGDGTFGGCTTYTGANILPTQLIRATTGYVQPYATNGANYANVSFSGAVFRGSISYRG